MDDLDAARGLLIAVVLSIIFWGVVLYVCACI